MYCQASDLTRVGSRLREGERNLHFAMNDRKRCGYLWLTQNEEGQMNELIETLPIYRKCSALRTKADFIRIAAFALASVLQKKKISVPQNATEQDLINLIIKSLHD